MIIKLLSLILIAAIVFGLCFTIVIFYLISWHNDLSNFEIDINEEDILKELMK
jgi:hypothetical protein